MKSIILDLDGTVCDTTNREHYITREALRSAMKFDGSSGIQKAWDNFHAGIENDTANMDVLELLDCLRQMKPEPYGIIIVTGRPEMYRVNTQRWLRRYLVPYDALLMRPDGDKEDSGAMKVRLLESWLGPTKQEVLSKVAFCLEDRDSVVEAFRAYGLPTWQVRKGVY